MYIQVWLKLEKFQKIISLFHFHRCYFSLSRVLLVHLGLTRLQQHRQQAQAIQAARPQTCLMLLLFGLSVQLDHEFGWWRGIVGSAFRLKRSYSMPGLVSTAMGDCLRAGKPSRCEACQLGRLSLLPSVGW